jgi:electron transport complex protein RnfD
MAAKVMLWPSPRSKFVKPKNMELIYKVLLVLSGIMVLNNYYMYSFMHAVKLALMIVVAIVLTVESEILFYSHDKDVDRKEAKALITKSYPKITALIYVLLIPIGTPLWLVGIGAILATFLGKLIFGGFAHMVFHTSLVGVLFVTLGWPQLVDGVAFITSFDNYLLELIFDNNFFNETLSIGSVFDPSNMTTSLGMLLNGDSYKFYEVFLGIVPGIVGSGLVLVGIFGFLLYKKAINWITPVTMLGSFLLTAVIIAIVNEYDIIFPLYQLFSGSFFFVMIFVVSDPITTPIPTKGKIIFGLIAGALTMFIRQGVKYEEGVIFAVLFMMMLTPLLNQTFKEKKPVKKAPPKKEAV